MKAVSTLAATTCSSTFGPAAFRRKTVVLGSTAWMMAEPSPTARFTATKSPVAGNSERRVDWWNLPATSPQTSPASVASRYFPLCCAMTRAGRHPSGA